MEETRVPGENHWLVASDWQTLSYNVVSSTPCLSQIPIHNVSGDRHWLHRYLKIQLQYDHDGPFVQSVLFIKNQQNEQKRWKICSEISNV